MGIYRHFPYSNFHELNEDWLLFEMRRLSLEWIETKGNLEQWITDTDEAFNNLQNYVMTYFDNLDIQEEINNKINDMVTSGEFEAIIKPYLDDMTARLEAVIEDFEIATNRKILIIGDSYNTGTGGGQSINTMVPYISIASGVPEDRILNYSVGGSGFIRNSDDTNPSFERNLDTAISEITDKKTVTDIIVIGGANDGTANPTTLNSNMNRFVGKAKSNFVNAKLWLFAVGWAVDSGDRYNLINAYRYYANNGFFAYSRLYHILQNKNLMFNNFHPNQNGVAELGKAIGSILVGGNYGIEAVSPLVAYYYFGTSGVQTQVRTWCDPDNVYVQFSNAPSENTTEFQLKYQTNELGIGYLNHIYGNGNVDFVNQPIEFLSADATGQFKHGTMLMAFARYGDGLEDKRIRVLARTYNTENGALTPINIKRLYLSNKVITIPIWDA